MGKIFLTSDLHFGHSKPFLYEPRGFSSIEEHDAAIVENWNAVVDDGDVVWVLGDLMLNDNHHGIECLKQLKGEIHFICGNHENLTRPALYEEIGLINEGYANILRYKKWHFYLSHYCALTANFDDGTSVRARTWNLAGHSHTTDRFIEMRQGRASYHVELDCHNNTPVLLDDIIEDIKEFYNEYRMDSK